MPPVDEGDQEAEITNSVDWNGTFNLESFIHSFKIAKDKQNRVKAQAVFLIDPSSGSPMTARGATTITDPVTTTRKMYVIAVPQGSDVLGSGFAFGIAADVFNHYFDSDSGNWRRARAPGKMASPAAAASPISVIAAGGAGTFYRIFKIFATLTVAGNLTVSDGTTNWLNTAAIPANAVQIFDYGPNGIPGTGTASAVTATFTGGGNGAIVILYSGPSTSA